MVTDLTNPDNFSFSAISIINKDQCDSIITKLITMLLDWYSGDINTIVIKNFLGIIDSLKGISKTLAKVDYF